MLGDFMKKLLNTLKKLLEEKPNAIIAIDGCCASGKTTFAKHLEKKFGFQVIHTDDFFLPLEMRTEERLSQAGGNIHYERFNDEVIKGIKCGKDFEYRIFSCKAGTFCGTKSISLLKPIVIEGAYALHPETADIYDLKVFFSIDAETQLKRILERNGADALENFKNKWIPFENLYFEAYNIKSKCDIIISEKQTEKTDRKP